MKKCLIVCWFGNIPNYYKLWENSCKNNSDYDFLIFTDQEISSDVKNIKIINISLREIKRLIENKLNIKTKFSKSYKMCDFRPAFGVIFDKYVKGYDYWGHCDMDLVFGKISDFLPDKKISKYEKINHNGHFVLYKNTKKINNLFREKGAIFDWVKVFCSEENYAFDEFTGINKIVQKNDISQYSSDGFIDLDRRYSRYRAINHRNWKNQIFVLENGHINRYIYENKIIKREDNFFYLHFQKKKPNIAKNIDYNKKIAMGESKFANIDEITVDSFKEFNPSKNSFSEKFELFKYYYYKVVEFVRSSKVEKKIKIKQKGLL